ncbi:hypothetical protein QFW77_14315 [Luteimonas sp. RD2P54]|uniref:Uncharacterized protein n=1 Tax=Luteimonas endophytica TaxID=3042023 RepID=A0ABT6JC08_9GAMM|nr:hypothetical protein [Luteimonas endophytica]MDH5824152.1 hypothetical protein [Luteimonas endophytica]
MAAPAPDPIEQALQLLRLLEADDLDAAIEAGLARFDATVVPGLPPAALARLRAARERLLAAWAARDRHRARNARLARRAEAREARRARPAPAAAARPALPPAAAAALARARARAGRERE